MRIYTHSWQEIDAVYEQIKFSWLWQIQHNSNQRKLLEYVDDGIRQYQELRGFWQDELWWHEYILNQSTISTSDAVKATLLNNLAGVYLDIGNLAQAVEFLEDVLKIDRSTGDIAAMSITINNLGMVYHALGDRQQALAYLEQALPIHRQVGNRTMEATTLNNIGSVYDALGDKQGALAYYEQALPLFRQVGDKGGEATTLNNIGLVYDALGDKQGALAYYEQALPLLRQVGDRWVESITCYNMAMVYRSKGDLAMAEQWLMRRVELDEAIGHLDLASDRAMLEQVRQEQQAG